MTIRTAIVDDEPLARQGLLDFASEECDLEIVAQCADGRSAVEAILKHRPDLVLLDVQMPELDGFGVLQAVGARRLPALIFLTAQDDQALQAIQTHAIDYLLKPVQRERFHWAVDRARAQLRHHTTVEVNRKIGELLSTLDRQREYREQFMIRSLRRVYFVQAVEISWIEAAGNYARLYTPSGRHVIRQTMAELERELDPQRFRRIHRSTIVRLDRIHEIQPWFNADAVVVLKDGTRLSLSRKYRHQLDNRRLVG